MSEEISLNFTLKESAIISLKGAGLGGVSGGIVGGAGRYLLGFRQVTPLTGVVTGTVFGGLYFLAAIVSGFSMMLILNTCGLAKYDIIEFSALTGGAVLDFVVTPLVAGLVGFPIASYWQFLAELVAQVVIGALIYKGLKAI